MFLHLSKAGRGVGGKPLRELDWFSLHLGAHQAAGSNSLLRYLLRSSGWPAAFVLVSPVFLGFAGSENVRVFSGD